MVVVVVVVVVCVCVVGGWSFWYMHFCVCTRGLSLNDPLPPCMKESRCRGAAARG